jgi:type I restriction enzyme S subunit
MSGEWVNMRLMDVCETITDGAHMSPKDHPNGRPMASVKDLYRWGVDVESARRVAPEDFDSLVRNGCKPQVGDVLIAKDGATCLDTVCVYNQPDEIVLLSSVAILRPMPSLDSFFLKYYLESEETRAMLKSGYVSGSAIPRVVLKDFRRAPIPLPPLPEQRRIAKILGDLDDKIELNRKMNETLEQMARALFKSWFIDFYPVRAKMEGRQPPGMDADTAALFPSRLVESELGLIPEGWEVGSLGDVASNPRRGVQPSEINPDTPYIALEHMPRRCIALGDWDNSADVASGKYAFKRGEILFGKLRPYFHKVGVAPLDGICSTDILVVAPIVPEWFGFVLGHISSDALIQFTDLASTGTKMPRTNWGDLSSFTTTLPPKLLAAAFAQQVKPMVECITTNIHQSRTLASLRDTLLPQLMRGEVV